MVDPNEHAAGALPGNDENDATMLTPIHRAEFERGLRFTHIMMEETQTEGISAMARVNALAALLVEKGIVAPDELDEALTQAAEQVQASMRPHIRLSDVGDKYADGEAVDVDCLSLLPICQARCCSLKFWLTKQDLDEGVARWDYGNPYWIQQAADGYCVHFDRNAHGCTIHAQRPHICRKYDCRTDKRIWIDFEQRILAPREPGSGNAEPGMQDVLSHGSTATLS